MGRVAALLGKPFMPWQQYVADVSLEIDPATGRLVFSEVGLTVPRQSGKSTLLLCKAVHRASAQGFFGPRQRIVYTAQTRQKAREKWEEDYAAELEMSKVFRSRINVHKGNGNEHIRFSNGSRFGIEANTEKAGHGGTLDEAYEDEAFALQDNRLEQAFRPAMITRKNTQLWYVSTAGWLDGSPYLEAKVKKGRELAEAGVCTGAAYFEWSAPEDADPEDRAVWWDCMPALGHTIDEDAIAGELRDMDLNDFKRAYLNQWVPKKAEDASVISEALWSQLTDTASSCGDTIALAIDIPPSRATATISAAGSRADGHSHVETIDRRPGTEWVVPRLLELVGRWRPCALVIDKGSPAGSLITDCENAGLEVTIPAVQQVGQACGAFFDAVYQQDVFHLPDPDLTAAALGATKRSIGPDGLWAWDRKNFTVDISPLVAGTLALWGFKTKQGEVIDVTRSVW